MKAIINIDGKKTCCVGPTLSGKELSLVRSEVNSNAGFAEFACALSALGHETRATIFAILTVASSVCVCDLAEILGITPSAVSQHLNKMKAARVVRFQRKAQTIYYSLTDTPVNKLLARAHRQTNKQGAVRSEAA